jgi:two-component system cell cycle sensor histidine kinase/response regulator CckA
MNGHCDLMLLQRSPDEPIYADLVQIQQNANRAAALVRQLLAFSRKQTLQPDTIDLREVMSDVSHLLSRLVADDVNLRVEHEDNLSLVYLDPQQFEQVIMNLVVNARDAMPDGGDVVVRTDNKTLKRPLVRERATVPPGHYVRVQVIDQGGGIDRDKKEKVFEPFYTTKNTGEGTGLGLSTAYGIVKQSGGFIFLDSEVGKGTTFTLLFPTAEKKPPVFVRNPKQPKVEADASGTILLVEDEAPVRAFASRALRLKGFSVLEASCGEEALEILEDEDLQIDLFLTDVSMPGIDGPTWVKKARETRGSPVIFISGYAEEKFADHSSHVADAVFLPKPFSLEQLVGTVRQQLVTESLKAVV